MSFLKRLLSRPPAPQAPAGPESTGERGSISAWSRENGFGRVRLPGGEELPFDAGVCTVGDLRSGEAVRVQLDATRRRVTRLEPWPRAEFAARPLEPRIRVEETALLDLRFDDPGALAELEDRLFDRHGIPMIWQEAGFVRLDSGFDGPAYGATVRAFLEEQVGRALETLVRVDADYPFDWRRGDADVLGRIYPQLPGYQLRDGQLAFFGADPARPPHLTVSFEPPGLQVCGVLRRAQWSAWAEAFERAARGALVYRTA